MNDDSAWNMYVFRDGGRSVAGATLARELARELEHAFSFPVDNRRDEYLNALLRAGELECGLSDLGDRQASEAAFITDSVAAALIGLPECTELDCLLGHLPKDHPKEIRVSPPEGFAYYALHPLDFADMAGELPLSGKTVCVIGIRSIGATLGALVLAALLNREGITGDRFTVRPNGHPYNRQTCFNAEQSSQVARFEEQSADFVVVDEGPGMSGSSLLSVGDALVRAGVPHERITFLCSRIPDPDTLRAEDAGRRWRSYRSFCVKQNSRLPLDAKIYIGGGDWRQFAFREVSEWPASWTQMERLKFLSTDGRRLFKFEGFGRFGKDVYRRACAIAEAGFGPVPLEFKDGFGVYRTIQGQPLTLRDLSQEVLERMAEYCAFRATAFRCDSGQDSAQLEEMVRFNLSQEFGCELPMDSGALHSGAPVFVDGRMLPHEWLRTTSGKLLKVDGASHGDDHFFPGPTDIAWDVAGAIVEWNMKEDEASRFITRFQELTGDNIGKRIGDFVLAYAIFRLAYCKMAAAAVRGSGEEHRLAAQGHQYKAFLESRLPLPVPA